MKKLRIGVLGCSSFAKKTIIPVIMDSEKYELTGIASRNMGKAKSLCSSFNCLPFGSYDELIRSELIDCVYMPLPCGLHHEWLKKCINHNKPVLVEKSFSDDLRKTKEIISLAFQRNIVLVENFAVFNHPQFLWTIDNLQMIGDLKNVRMSFGFPPRSKDDIRYSLSLSGGALLDAGAYCIKAAKIILGSKAKLCYSQSFFYGNEVDWGGMGIFESDEIGCQFTFGFNHFYQNEIEFWGSKGKLTLTRAFSIPCANNSKIIFESADNKKEITLPSYNHFYFLFDHFAELIHFQNHSKLDAEYKQILNQSEEIQKFKIMAGTK